MRLQWYRLIPFFVELSLLSADELPPDTVDPEGCRLRQADVVFVLDQSGSVGRKYYQIGLNATAEFAWKLLAYPYPIPAKNRIGVALFDDAGTLAFGLNRYNTWNETESAILTLSYSAGETNIGAGIETGIQIFKNDPREQAGNTTRIMILVTDGADESNVSLMGSQARNNNITLYAIGVLPMVDKEELESATDEKNVYYINSYTALANMFTKICLAESLQKKCRLDATDFVFVIDRSSNVGVKNFELAWKAAVAFTDSLTIGPGSNKNASRVGAVFFNKQARSAINLTEYESNDEFRNASGQHHICGGSNLAAAMHYAIMNLFKVPPERNALQVLLIITDASDSTFVTDELALATQRSISVYAIGIGPDVSREHLVRATGSADHAVFADADDTSVSHAVHNICAVLGTNGCGSEPIDMVFLLADPETGELALQGALDFTFVLSIGATSDKSRVGLVHFGYRYVDFGFALSDHTSVSAVRAAIAQIHCNYENITDLAAMADTVKEVGDGNGIDIANAMKVAIKEVFLPSHRDGVSRVMLIITNGKDLTDVDMEHTQAWENNITVYAIGVSSGVSVAELINATGSEDNVFLFDDYSKISITSEHICNKIGNIPDAPRPHSCGCESTELNILQYWLDIVFVIDVSSNMHADVLSKVVDLIRSFARDHAVPIDQRPALSRIGIITASDRLDVQNFYKMHSASDSDWEAILGRIQVSKSSAFRAADALSGARAMINRYRRSNVPNVVVVVTSKNITCKDLLPSDSSSLTHGYATELGYSGPCLKTFFDTEDTSFMVLFQEGNHKSLTLDIADDCSLVNITDISDTEQHKKAADRIYQLFCYANCYCQENQSNDKSQFLQLPYPEADLCSRRATCIHPASDANSYVLAESYCIRMSSLLSYPVEQEDESSIGAIIRTERNATRYWVGIRITGGQIYYDVDGNSVQMDLDAYQNWCPDVGWEQNGCVYEKPSDTASGYCWEIDDCGPAYYFGCQKAACSVTNQCGLE